MTQLKLNGNWQKHYIYTRKSTKLRANRMINKIGKTKRKKLMHTPM